MKEYTWAMNKQKLARAVANVGSDASEGVVKKNYIALGGKVALSDLKTKDIMENKNEEVESEVTGTSTEPAVSSEDTSATAPESTEETSEVSEATVEDAPAPEAEPMKEDDTNM